MVGQQHHPMASGFAWDAKRLQFAVREPFPSKATGTNLVFGKVTQTQSLRLESYMPEQGVIFSDGIEADAIPFNSGCIAEIKVSGKEGILVN